MFNFNKNGFDCRAVLQGKVGTALKQTLGVGRTLKLPNIGKIRRPLIKKRLGRNLTLLLGICNTRKKGASTSHKIKSLVSLCGVSGAFKYRNKLNIKSVVKFLSKRKGTPILGWGGTSRHSRLGKLWGALIKTLSNKPLRKRGYKIYNPKRGGKNFFYKNNKRGGRNFWGRKTNPFRRSNKNTRRGRNKRRFSIRKVRSYSALHRVLRKSLKWAKIFGKLNKALLMSSFGGCRGFGGNIYLNHSSNPGRVLMSLKIILRGRKPIVTYVPRKKKFLKRLSRKRRIRRAWSGVMCNFLNDWAGNYLKPFESFSTKEFNYVPVENYVTGHCPEKIGPSLKGFFKRTSLTPINIDPSKDVNRPNLGAVGFIFGKNTLNFSSFKHFGEVENLKVRSKKGTALGRPSNPVDVYRNTSSVVNFFLLKFTQAYRVRKFRFSKKRNYFSNSFKKSIINLIFFKNTDDVRGLLRSFFYWNSYKKHNLVLNAFKKLFKYNTTRVLGIYKISGISVLMRGKLKSTGGAKKRLKRFSIGKVSSSYNSSKTYNRSESFITRVGALTFGFRIN